jgi:hypothetical protein
MSTMTLALTTNRMQVEFEPIDYHPRTGRSSFRPIRDTYNYFLTIIRAMTYFDPLRIFITPAMILFLAAVAMTVRNLWTTASVGFLPSLLFLGSMLLFTIAIISDQFASLAKAIDWGSRIRLDDRLIEELDWSEPAPEHGRA